MVLGSYKEVTYHFRMCISVGGIIYTMREKIIKNYTKIPNELFEAPISHAAFRLYCYLLSVPDDFKPSIAKIASDISMSKTTLLRSQNELIKNKMMFRSDTNEFYIKRAILLPESWEFETKERVKKKGRKWSEQDKARSKLVRLRSKLDQEVDQVGPRGGPSWTKARTKLNQAVDQVEPSDGPSWTKRWTKLNQEVDQVGPTNKTTQQDYTTRLHNKT